MLAGWMWKEGHRRKTWKRRYCVVYPRDYAVRGMDAPIMFYYDDEESGDKPKGTFSLANIKCRLPKSRRKEYPFAFRVDVESAADGHGKYILAPEAEEEMIRASFVLLDSFVVPFHQRSM
jgi:hypothetical protein